MGSELIRVYFEMHVLTVIIGDFALCGVKSVAMNSKLNKLVGTHSLC